VSVAHQRLSVDAFIFFSVKRIHERAQKFIWLERDSFRGRIAYGKVPIEVFSARRDCNEDHVVSIPPGQAVLRKLQVFSALDRSVTRNQSDL
jgi:hypothetical protein